MNSLETVDILTLLKRIETLEKKAGTGKRVAKKKKEVVAANIQYGGVASAQPPAHAMTSIDSNGSKGRASDARRQNSLK